MTMTITDLTTPDYAGIGVGITDTCGLCRKPFDLTAPPAQYPTLPNDMGEPEELICDACQDVMEDDRDEDPAVIRKGDAVTYLGHPATVVHGYDEADPWLPPAGDRRPPVVNIRFTPPVRNMSPQMDVPAGSLLSRKGE